MDMAWHRAARHGRTREDKRDPEISGSLACIILPHSKSVQIQHCCHETWLVRRLHSPPAVERKMKAEGGLKGLPILGFHYKIRGTCKKKTSLARKSLLNPSTKPHTQDELIKVKEFTFLVAQDCSRLLTIAHDCSRLLTIAHDFSRLLTYLKS